MASSSKRDEGPAYLDEHHQRITEFANDYFDDDEREDFINTLMERRGYQRRSAWALPEPPTGPEGGGQDPAAGPKRPPYFKR